MNSGDGKPAQVAANTLRGGQFRYYDFMMAAFVAIILLSNVLGAGKVSQVWLPFYNDYWPFGAGGSATTTHDISAMNRTATVPAQITRRARA